MRCVDLWNSGDCFWDRNGIFSNVHLIAKIRSYWKTVKYFSGIKFKNENEKLIYYLLVVFCSQKQSFSNAVLVVEEDDHWKKKALMYSVLQYMKLRIERTL